MKAKFFFIALFFTASSPVASAQQTPGLRFGVYLDFFRFGPPGLEPGGLVEFAPAKWYALKAGTGVLFSDNTFWAECGLNCTATVRQFRPVAATFTVTPSILVGKRLSIDPNLRIFAGRAVKAEFAPGFSLRHDKFQIRANYHLSSGLLGMGLAFFPKRDVNPSKP